MHRQQLFLDERRESLAVWSGAELLFVEIEVERGGLRPEPRQVICDSGNAQSDVSRSASSARASVFQRTDPRTSRCPALQDALLICSRAQAGCVRHAGFNEKSPHHKQRSRKDAGVAPIQSRAGPMTIPHAAVSWRNTSANKFGMQDSIELPSDLAAQQKSVAQFRELDALGFPVKTADSTVRGSNVRQADALQHLEHHSVDVVPRLRRC